RRRHTRFSRDWSSDVCSSDLACGISLPLVRYREVRNVFGVAAFAIGFGARSRAGPALSGRLGHGRTKLQFEASFAARPEADSGISGGVVTGQSALVDPFGQTYASHRTPAVRGSAGVKGARAVSPGCLQIFHDQCPERRRHDGVGIIVAAPPPYAARTTVAGGGYAITGFEVYDQRGAPRCHRCLCANLGIRKNGRARPRGADRLGAAALVAAVELNVRNSDIDGVRVRRARLPIELPLQTDDLGVRASFDTGPPGIEIAERDTYGRGRVVDHDGRTRGVDALLVLRFFRFEQAAAPRRLTLARHRRVVLKPRTQLHGHIRADDLE